MQIILTTIGTDGDVIPYVALGAVLRSRGHRVTLATSEDYAAMAAEHGLEFASLFSRAEHAQFLGNPDFWHPLKGPLTAARWGARKIARNYELLAGLANEPNSVLVASPGLIAARVVREQLGTPMASIILQPWMIGSCIEPPVMPAGVSLPRWAPRFVGEAYWRMVDEVGNLLLGRELQALRKSLGLRGRVLRVFSWWMSPDRMIGMFPAWYGPPQTDWAPQIRLTGFPMHDGRVGARLSEDVAEFCAAGPPPVAFTFGTGMMHAQKLFAASLEACQRLGVRGIFLTRFAEQLPALPPSVKHVAFAPFSELFPRCAAVVHHGGVGTVAKALAAGVPQVILPLAYDQKDNAIRVKRLGAGDWVRAGRASGPAISEKLASVMGDDFRARCAKLAGQFSGECALEAAAREVEALCGA